MPVKTTGTDENIFEELVSKLSEGFSKPSSVNPVVHCASRTTLIHAVSEIKNTSTSSRLRKSSAKSLLDHLNRAGLIHRIPVSQNRPEAGYQIFSVGFGVTPDEVSFPEILMALVPDGVICFFSAIHLHGLSTQIPPFHHIAKLRRTDKGIEREGGAFSKPSAGSSASQSRNRLGELIFDHEGYPYYVTKRQAERVPGQQQMYHGENSLIRITDREQTILDTLARPLSCGGPSVVFEVWNTAIESSDVGRIVQLIQSIGDCNLARRAGYMLESTGLTDAADVISTWLEQCEANAPELSEPPSLLLGVAYSNLSSRWKLRVP